MNFQRAAGRETAALFLREPWKAHAHKTKEQRQRILDVVIMCFEHNSDQIALPAIKRWKKGLNL